MKRFFSILVALIILFSLCACSMQITEAPTSERATESECVTSNQYFSFIGLAVDESYEDPDGKPLTLVYLLYTIKTDDVNLEIDSVGTEMTINGINTYSPEHLPTCKDNTTKYMPNYLYTSYITDVYMGETIKVTATFRIPKAELTEGRTITLADDQIPEIQSIRLKTDLIKTFSKSIDIAKEYDRDGYNKETTLRSTISNWSVESKNWYFHVDDMFDIAFQTAHEWSCVVNNTTYWVSLWNDWDYRDENTSDWEEATKYCYRFLVRTGLGTEAGGWFSVSRGYIICTYDTNGAVVEIPWTFNEDKLRDDPDRYWNWESTGNGVSYTYYPECIELVSLDLIAAFDIYS